MTPPRSDAGHARLSDVELEAMLERAAEEGARRALSDVGLGGQDAVLTIHDMRSLLECISFVRRTAVQTAVHVITSAMLVGLLTGVAMNAVGSIRTTDRSNPCTPTARPFGGPICFEGPMTFYSHWRNVSRLAGAAEDGHPRTSVLRRLQYSTGAWLRRTRMPEPKGNALLHLVVTWRPMERDAVARVGALLKLAEGARIEAAARPALEGQEPAGRWVAVETGDWRLPLDGPLAGPAWRIARGRLLPLPAGTAALRATVAGIRSPPVRRPVPGESLTLTPLAPDFGLPGEPHLEWRFTNLTADRLDVRTVLADLRLRIDGAPAPAPVGTYDGPASLPPGRELGGLWCLDDIDGSLRRRPAVFELETLGHGSAPVHWPGSD